MNTAIPERRFQLFYLTHSSSCKSACREARLFILLSLLSGGTPWRDGEVAARDGEAVWREGERDGEREEGEREEEDGDGVLCWENSGRAAASATMAMDSSLESHTVTSWRVCRKMERDGEGKVMKVFYCTGQWCGSEQRMLFKVHEPWY